MARMTLTFDNGPWPGITDHVLEVLDKYSVKATFFLVGDRLLDPASRRLAETAHASGHWIGNHTMSHGAPLGERGSEVVAREIGDMNTLLGDLTHEQRFFRPNGRGKVGPHLLSPAAVEYLHADAATIVLWTHVPKDKGVAVDAWVEDAKNAVLSRDWSLLVLHDRPSGHDNPAGSMAYLERFLAWARREQVEIVQALPAACTPMVRGIPVLPLDGLVCT